MGSPPYCEARTYDDGTLPAGRVVARDCRAWVEWMLHVTAEALRVSRGAVVWVAAGVTRGRNYWPACEGLMWRWWESGGHAYRPVYWHRYGIPGSGGDQWFRPDVEYCMCFKRPGRLPWSDPLALGKTPKFDAPGGAMSNRKRDGSRVVWNTGRRGPRDAGEWAGGTFHVDTANPGNLIDTGAAGGGNLGHPLAHENEAPYPTTVPEFFVKSLCKPGGIVLDPFSGSGTTASVALAHGRRAIGLDLRWSQAAIARQRIERPHAPVARDRRATDDLPGQLTMFPAPEPTTR